MAKVSLTAALRAEYETLFNTCVIRSNRAGSVQSLVNKLLGNRGRYESVQDASGVPWYFVAVVHNMEASQSFKGHLHNGDPLTARTVQVPAGRPKSGSPPFKWEFSAADALAYEGLSSASDWTLAGTLYNLERFNGWGYRLSHPHTLSPYLWSFSNHYTSGKYVKDGVWSDSAVSDQCGAAVLLRRFAELGEATLTGPVSSGPTVPSYSVSKSKNPAVVAQVEELQRWLSTFPNIFLKVDGVPGPHTSDAYEQVTGHRLPGDPR